MSQAVPQTAMPKALALGVGIIIAATMVLVTMRRDIPLDPARAGVPALQVRELRFADRADGAVVATDARDGRGVAVFDPGTSGFVRGTLRGLSRERKREDLGPERPFRLTAWADGRLTLEDTATGRIVEMTAFGQTNQQTFRGLLASKEE